MSLTVPASGKINLTNQKHMQLNFYTRLHFDSPKDPVAFVLACNERIWTHLYLSFEVDIAKSESPVFLFIGRSVPAREELGYERKMVL